MTALADQPSRLRPPGPSPWSAPALLARMARNRLDVMRSVSARYGDAVRLPLGPKTLYFFNHPDHAKHVLAENPGNYHKGIGLVHARRTLGDGLLTSEGELWRKQRKTIQPVFQARRIARQAGAIAEEAVGLADRLHTMVGRDEPVDIRHEMTDLTLGVLGRTLLDTDLGEFGGIGDAFEAVQDQAIFEMMSLGAVPTWVPLPRQRRFRRARAELQDVVDQLVARRRAAGGIAERDDVVSRLIGSTNEEADPQVARQRMRDELVTLLLAGHETTASTLTWAFHLLDRHHDVWERVHAEAVEVLGDRTPVYEDLHRLRYTAMVVDEVMRLYPPVWLLPRIAQGDDVVGGYHVPAGADLVLCPYTLHRHPDFWAHPDRFDPDRFDPDRSTDRPRYAYIPFGAGPRFCVGNNLGLMEAVFVIACVARRLRMSVQPGYRLVPEPMLTLRVRGGLPMRVHEA
ncbi:cytochrome P450 [Solwaraspora sp. WMMA2065]|uniref:cytochrome P450 n=1 Tax=Solwaraspora sp. WMMA2065 TaxID=3015166 RepID=UPI00259BD2E3|nr:cytochrome P450 [Solwaraspora sp. WMMA2065]WJK32356.1 cytochrome P450 [Solwaraspora sp. WMMA2065]